MKRTVRILCLLLCICLLPVLSACGTARAEESAPTVRVLLRRLALTDRADLTLDARYTAGFGGSDIVSFPRGAQVTVQVHGGDLYLYYQGMVINAGERLDFTRRSSGADRLAGLRFSGASGDYPGDLSLTISGGALLPVLTVSVEDYLLGVLPYEMSESFPLEALKAQAVCARTYALSHLSPGRAWDVVDTTNDQVFRGLSQSNVNVARAVSETAGVVGMYGGQLAVCYYGASNGGQTELPENYWGGPSLGCYAITDDPYDLANPESLALRAAVEKISPALPDTLTAALFEQLLPTIAYWGFQPDETMFRVDTLAGLELTAPAHAAPSRQYTAITLTFSWSGRRLITRTEDEDISLFSAAMPDGVDPEDDVYLSDFQAAPVISVVTLPLYPDLVRALKLSISGLDNEMITVRDEGSRFVLEARRYGHGVGMSQRGAQQMAREGKTFDQILAFYYPGMKLMQAPSAARPLPTVPPLLAATPGPAATATPRPTLMPVTAASLPAGAWLASVEGIEDDSSLNLRAEPHQAASILMRLYKHQQLIVLEACEDPAWVHVKTDAAEGYVMVSFLERR